MKKNVDSGRIYYRHDDMSCDIDLNVIMSVVDGDISLFISRGPIPLEHDDKPIGVEFCSRCGGGQSPHTRKALVNLMLAMERDNKENPHLSLARKKVQEV